MIGGFGPTELIVVFAALMLLFGAAKIPELARSLGASMGEFKKAQKEAEISLNEFDQSVKEITSSEETETASKAEG